MGHAIKYAYFERRTTLLGPGNRFVLWVQGCKKCCKGCISPEMQALEGGFEISTDKLAEEILRDSEIEGITISGGEPFLQAEELLDLVCKIKKERQNINVLIYTGYVYEDLYNSSVFHIVELLKKTDILIDGEYKDELNDDVAYRGSSNQRILLLNEKFKDIYELYYSTRSRKSEIIIDKNRISLIGVPSKRTVELMKNIAERRNKDGEDN